MFFQGKKPKRFIALLCPKSASSLRGHVLAPYKISLLSAWTLIFLSAPYVCAHNMNITRSRRRNWRRGGGGTQSALLRYSQFLPQGLTRGKF
jgi:hypothetical protein